MSVSNLLVNKKHFIYVFVFLLSILITFESVNAACARTDIGYCSESFIVQKGGTLSLGKYETTNLKRQNDSRNVYCIKRKVKSPAYGSQKDYTRRTCSSSYSFSSNNDKIRAAVGYILSTSLSYKEKQYLIHRFLYKKASGAETVYVSGYDTYYNNAEKAYNNYPSTPGTYYLAKFYSCGSGIQPIADGYETKIVENKVHIAYHPNGGTITGKLNQYGWIFYNNETYFHHIKHGDSADPYNASTFNLTRSGYSFNGWKVHSTGKILDQNTKYASTVYAQHDNKNKTTANTANVYCYLYAQWNPNKVKIAYNINGGTLSRESTYSLNSYNFVSNGSNVYFHTINYGSKSDPYNASTFKLTRPGYSFNGWKVHSTGKILDQNTEYDSTVYAQYDDKNKTTANTANVTSYLYAQWNPNKLTIVYHSNGATTKKLKGKVFTADSAIPNQVLEVGKGNSSGLYDIQNSDYLNLTKTGNVSTGNWLLGSTTSTTKLNQTTAITWDGAKAKIGSTVIADLSTGSRTIHVYPEWQPKKLTVIFHKNDGSNATVPQVFTYGVTGNKFGYNTNGTPKWAQTGQFGAWDRVGHQLLGWAKTSTATARAYTIYSGVTDNFIDSHCSGATGTLDLYGVWNPYVLTIVYHSNGATKIELEGKKITENQLASNTQKMKYGQSYPSGLYNSNNRNYLFLTKKGYGVTGNWLVGSNTSSIKINHDESGKAEDFAAKMNVDISKESKTVHVYAEWLAMFTIYKKNSSGSPIYTETYFSIYSNLNDCNAGRNEKQDVTTKNGYATVNLLPGNYYIKETGVENPEYYFVDSTCQAFTVGQQESGEITIVNKTKCEEAFKNTISDRINVFKSFPAYNNLLNFEKTTAIEACTSYTPTYENENSCLVTKQNQTTTNEFKSTDLSSFNDVLNVNSVDVGYCVTDFNVETTLSVPNTKIKAGMLVVGSTSDQKALTSTLTKKCYVYGNVGTEVSDIKSYDDYVSNIYIGANPLRKGTLTSNKITLKHIRTEANGLKYYEGKVSVDYYFNPICVKKISGRISDISCSPDIDTKSGHRFVGYGILSEFQEGKNDTSGFKYSVNFKNLSNSNKQNLNIFNTVDNTCSYEVEPEVIQYTPDKIDGELNLDFRIVDPDKPFERDTKTNWSDGSDNSSNNKIVSDNIINAPNSYNQDGLNSMYYTDESTKKIILDSNLINRIREWNADHKYDNSPYELNDGVYSNAFFNYIGLKKN